MQVINLTHNYRVARLDERNWKMQHFHAPATTSRTSEPDVPRWYDTGHYFQNLGAALAFVYERVLREPDGIEAELAEAMSEARELHDSLAALAADLTGLPAEEAADDKADAAKSEND